MLALGIGSERGLALGWRVMNYIWGAWDGWELPVYCSTSREGK